MLRHLLAEPNPDHPLMHDIVGWMVGTEEGGELMTCSQSNEYRHNHAVFTEKGGLVWRSPNGRLIAIAAKQWTLKHATANTIPARAVSSTVESEIKEEPSKRKETAEMAQGDCPLLLFLFRPKGGDQQMTIRCFVQCGAATETRPVQQNTREETAEEDQTRQLKHNLH